jgi:hypothetical protein
MKWINRTILAVSATTLVIVSSPGLIVTSSMILVGAGVNEIFQTIKKG